MIAKPVKIIGMSIFITGILFTIGLIIGTHIGHNERI